MAVMHALARWETWAGAVFFFSILYAILKIVVPIPRGAAELLETGARLSKATDDGDYLQMAALVAGLRWRRRKRWLAALAAVGGLAVVVVGVVLAPEVLAAPWWVFAALVGAAAVIGKASKY